MQPNREEIMEKAKNLLSGSPEFKDFHGKVEFNFAFGQVKKYSVNQTYLPKKEKK